MTDRVPCLLVCSLFALPFAPPTHAADWPQFRGPERDGVAKESGLLTTWPAGGPPVVLRQPIGEGYSAISVVGDRLYTMHTSKIGEEEREVAVALSLDGKTVWSTPVDTKIVTEFGNGPRSTPTVVGDSVVVLGSHGKLAALDRATGAVKWTVDLVSAYGAEVPGWGYSTSPLVVGDVVVVEAGGTQGKSYVGLDLATGKQRWTSGDDPGPGYNSPLLVTVGGKPRVVYVAGSSLRAIDPATGAEVWKHQWPDGETHAIPLFLPPDQVYASGAGEVGAQVVRIGADKAEPVWVERLMRNHFSAGVLLNGAIYAFDNSSLKCIDAKTGATHWVKRGLGKGSLIGMEGRLLILTDLGQLVLAEATTEAYKELAMIQAMEGKSWTAPVLANGRLYLRNHTEMVVYDLRVNPSAKPAAAP